MTEAAPPHRGRRDNGLSSDAFSPVADIDPRLADHLLDVLGLRDVPAYVEPAPASASIVSDRLYVAAARTGEAHALLNQLAAELGIEVSHAARRDITESRPDLLRGIDTDTEFQAIVAGLVELSTPLPRRQPSERVELERRRRADDDHYVPPPPPPVPRPALATASAALITVLGFFVIFFGEAVGLSPDLPFPMGVVLVLLGAGLLVVRLRPGPRDDSDDDGAVV